MLKKTTVKRTLKVADNFGSQTPKTKQFLYRLRQAFNKVSIFYHFHLKYYMYLETNLSNYGISKNQSQLTHSLAIKIV